MRRRQADELGDLGRLRRQGDRDRQRRLEVGGLIAPVRLAIDLVGEQAQIREGGPDLGQVGAPARRDGCRHEGQDTGTIRVTANSHRPLPERTTAEERR